MCSYTILRFPLVCLGITINFVQQCAITYYNRGITSGGSINIQRLPSSDTRAALWTNRKCVLFLYQLRKMYSSAHKSQGERDFCWCFDLSGTHCTYWNRLNSTQACHFMHVYFNNWKNKHSGSAKLGWLEQNGHCT